jgi:hypothetical protein
VCLQQEQHHGNRAKQYENPEIGIDSKRNQIDFGYVNSFVTTCSEIP